MAYSWDIVEPFTCIVTFSDGTFGYMYWVWTGKPYDVRGPEEFFGNRMSEKALKKNGVNMDVFESKL